jgi:membrane-bound ClpP family serine protease
MFASLLLWWWLSRYLPRLPYFNRLVLQAPGDAATVGAAAAITDPPPAAWPTVGMRGKVVADLRPGGIVAFYDDATNDTRTADVVCDCGYVPRGAEVIVREVAGNRIVVRTVS